MILHATVFVVALVGLIKSADYLVEYSARVARRFNLSELFVGLIITSIGTSLPELASSVSASLAGSSGLVIGNVVGSNIANIGLVLGTAALVRPFATDPQMHDRDGYILLLSVVVMFALVLDNRIGRIDAAVFLAIYVAYLVFAARTDRAGVSHQFRDFLGFVFNLQYVRPVARRLVGRRPVPDTTARIGARVAPAQSVAQSGSPRLEIGIIIVSLVALIISARFVVREAIWLARLFELPENLIGLSLVAVGTSLPELLVSIAAARKGKAALLVGNVMGSNIANTLLVLGTSAMIGPLAVSEVSVVYTVPIMGFFSLALISFVRSDWRISRAEGAIVLVGYVAFIATAFIMGWE